MKNPYRADEGDEMQSKYRVLLFRSLDSENLQYQKLSGPATALFPGLPIMPYQTQRGGILSLESLGKGFRAYPVDGRTNLPHNDLHCDQFPLVPIPALFKLKLKIFQRRGFQDAAKIFPYNETWTDATEENTVAALSNYSKFIGDVPKMNLDYFSSDHSFQEGNPNLLKRFGEVAIYHPSSGQIFSINSEVIEEYRAKYGSDFTNAMNEAEVAKLISGEPINFPSDVLTVENIQNNREMRQAVDASYESVTREVACYLINRPDGYFARMQEGKSDAQNSKFKTRYIPSVVDVLVEDALKITEKEGEENIRMLGKKMLDTSPRNSLKAMSLGFLDQKKTKTRQTDI
ncbi:MAG: hypothetical protein KGP29_00595 [Proteobacteria bacterium]|nr:hypothetical protein [Pseudomonadota bacterium]